MPPQANRSSRVRATNRGYAVFAVLVVGFIYTMFVLFCVCLAAVS